MFKPFTTYNHPGFKDVYMHVLRVDREATDYIELIVLWVNRHGNLAHDKNDTVRIQRKDFDNWESVDV
jgi:hypothetical protein